MSAYVVDPTHIDALLSVAIHGPKDRAPQYPGDGWYRPWAGSELGTLAPENASAVGADLLAECIESVSYRYPDCERHELPGPYPMPDPDQYEWTDLGPVLTVYDALHAIAGFEYQACEHPGWMASDAFAFCYRLTRSLIGALPGYSEGESNSWHITVEQAVERAGLRV